MSNIDKKHHSYMKMVKIWADGESYAKRRKVGALIVKDNAIISHGHNGTISGFINECEDEQGMTYNPHVLHAERNAIAKVAKSTQSTLGSTMYCTDMPCIGCAQMILQSGILELYFDKDYHDYSGLDLLLTSKSIRVFKLDIETGIGYELLPYIDHSLLKDVNIDKVLKVDRSIEQLTINLFGSSEMTSNIFAMESNRKMNINYSTDGGFNFEPSNNYLHFKKYDDQTLHDIYSPTYYEYRNGIKLKNGEIARITHIKVVSLND